MKRGRITRLTLAQKNPKLLTGMCVSEVNSCQSSLFYVDGKRRVEERGNIKLAVGSSKLFS